MHWGGHYLFWDRFWEGPPWVVILSWVAQIYIYTTNDDQESTTSTNFDSRSALICSLSSRIMDPFSVRRYFLQPSIKYPSLSTWYIDFLAYLVYWYSVEVEAWMAAKSEISALSDEGFLSGEGWKRLLLLMTTEVSKLSFSVRSALRSELFKSLLKSMLFCMSKSCPLTSSQFFSVSSSLFCSLLMAVSQLKLLLSNCLTGFKRLICYSLIFSNLAVSSLMTSSVDLLSSLVRHSSSCFTLLWQSFRCFFRVQAYFYILLSLFSSDSFTVMELSLCCKSSLDSSFVFMRLFTFYKVSLMTQSLFYRSSPQLKLKNSSDATFSISFLSSTLAFWKKVLRRFDISSLTSFPIFATSSFISFRMVTRTSSNF